ncbi:MAG: substrate-binding domain-containing protein [Acidimicrobiales bacterium]
MKRSRWAALLAVLLTFSLIAAACGDDDDTSSGGDDGAASDDGSSDDGSSDDGSTDDGSTDDGTSDDGSTDDGTSDDGGDDPAAAGLARAEAFIADYLGTPTSINVSEPLPEVPSSDVTFYWAECNFPVCNTIGDGIEAASADLGWTFQRVPYNPGNPEEVGSVHLQGVQSGADVVGTSGRPASEWETAIDAGMDAGVVFLDGYTTNDALGEENGIYACFGCEAQSQLAMEMMVNYLIADSGGNATIIYSTIPDFPIIAFRDTVMADVIDENCPNCELVTVEHSIQNLLEGAIPGRLISEIQNQSDAENLYVFFSFGDQSFGFADAVDEAGLLESVKIMGHDPGIGNLLNVRDGRELAWGGNPVVHVGYVMVDCYARILQDVGCNPDTLLPTEILVQGSQGLADAIAFNEEAGYNSPYVGVPGFQDEFRALWGVG